MVRIRFNQQTKEWDEIQKGEPKTDLDIVLPRLWLITLDRAKKDIANDLDVVVVCSGEPGSGKSTFLKLSCRYMSNERFNIRKHIIKSSKDVKRVIKGCEKGLDAVLGDEGSKLASSTNTMTKGTKFFNEVLDVVRQKNLFIGLAAPHFHRLGSQIAVDRSKVLVRTYLHKKTGQKGCMAFYGKDRKEKLYRYAKANCGSTKYPRAKYHSTFGKDLKDEEEYMKLKDDTLNDTLDSFDDGTKPKDKQPTERERKSSFNVELIKKNMDKPVKLMAELLQCNTRTVERYRSRALAEMSGNSESLQSEKHNIDTSDGSRD